MAAASAVEDLDDKAQRQEAADRYFISEESLIEILHTHNDFMRDGVAPDPRFLRLFAISFEARILPGKVGCAPKLQLLQW